MSSCPLRSRKRDLHFSSMTAMSGLDDVEQMSAVGAKCQEQAVRSMPAATSGNRDEGSHSSL